MVASLRSLLSSYLQKMGQLSSKLYSHDDEVEELKEEIWGDLSSVYYKYEDHNQKKAFREVIMDLSEELNRGNWKSIYHKLHNIECKNK
jgi:hypothetical protein